MHKARFFSCTCIRYIITFISPKGYVHRLLDSNPIIQFNNSSIETCSSAKALEVTVNNRFLFRCLTDHSILLVMILLRTATRYTLIPASTSQVSFLVGYFYKHLKINVDIFHHFDRRRVSSRTVDFARYEGF